MRSMVLVSGARALSGGAPGGVASAPAWDASVVARGADVAAAQGWRTRAPDEDDVAAIEKHQLRHRTHTIGVPATNRCAYGYPQAALQDPSMHKFGAGLLRLTCPHLCAAIDAWEAEGAVRDLSAALLGGGGARPLANRDAFDSVNARHAATRRALVDGGAEDRAVARLGRPGFDAAMASGIAGVSRHKLGDLKCLHVHVGDELLSGSNALGRAILDGLEDRGVDVGGVPTCAAQCAGCAEGYTPAKNKQKLWKTRERRAALKEQRRRGLPTSLDSAKGGL